MDNYFSPANQHILFIGNAASVLAYKNGKEIDSGKYIVCRFNNFKTEGFEEYVGTRTDIFLRRSCDDVFLHPAESFIKIFNFVTFGKHTAGMKIVARNLAGLYKNKLVNVNEIECAKYGAAAGLAQPIPEHASIGLLALAYFTEHFPNNTFSAIGFEFLHNMGDGATHYFPKKPVDSCYHNAEKEEKYLRSLPISFVDRLL